LRHSRTLEMFCQRHFVHDRSKISSQESNIIPADSNMEIEDRIPLHYSLHMPLSSPVKPPVGCSNQGTNVMKKRSREEVEAGAFKNGAKKGG